MTVYLEVTRDKYELPVNVADSQKELAILSGVSRKTVEQSIHRYKKNGNAGRFRKVIIEEDDDDR